MRIMQERLENERNLFLTKENELEQAEKNPLSQNYQLDTYEAVQKKLELREMEDEYLVDERDAVEGEVSDSDEEFEAIIEVDKLLKQLTELREQN